MFGTDVWRSSARIRALANPVTKFLGGGPDPVTFPNGYAHAVVSCAAADEAVTGQRRVASDAASL